MTNGAEHLLVLSLRLLRTAANEHMSNAIKGRALQRITAAQTESLTTLPVNASVTDAARIALASYFNKAAARRTRQAI